MLYANPIGGAIADIRRGDTMDATDIFIKSAKGEQEIVTKVNKLPIKHRSVLIMIDGKISEHALLARLSRMYDGKAIVADLESHGFIERRAAPKTALHALHAVENNGPLLNMTAKQYMIDTMYAVLGPEADTFVSKIEKCMSNSDLTSLVEPCSGTIAGIGKKKMAEEFSARLRELLG
jgi:hypothetical protein